MPGLLRGMARTAVAAGTWTAVSNRVARHQYNKWGEQEAQEYQQPQYAQQPEYSQPAAPVPNPEDERIAKLKDLANLKAQGILTEEEFAAEKARVLNG